MNTYFILSLGHYLTLQSLLFEVFQVWPFHLAMERWLFPSHKETADKTVSSLLCLYRQSFFTQHLKNLVSSFADLVKTQVRKCRKCRWFHSLFLEENNPVRSVCLLESVTLWIKMCQSDALCLVGHRLLSFRPAKCESNMTKDVRFQLKVPSESFMNWEIAVNLKGMNRHVLCGSVANNSRHKSWPVRGSNPRPWRYQHHALTN